MSEEKEEKGFLAQAKSKIIAGAGIALTTIGTMFIDEVKSIVGIEDEEPIQTEVVKQENTQSQSVNVAGPTIVVNVPEQKPQPTKTIIREVEKKPVKKKEKEQEIDW